MSRPKLLKQPGYIYDLNFIFFFKFNTELCVEFIPDNDQKDTTVAELHKMMADFGDIPEDLYVFFHAIETGRSFLPFFYFGPYKNEFVDNYSLDFLQDKLTDTDKLVRRIIKFYFYQLDDEETELCANSTEKIFSIIKGSAYSDEEKIKLYEFFINPSRYIQLLRSELTKKDILLTEYYKKNYQNALDVYDKTTDASLCEQIKNPNLDSFRGDGELYVSYCLLNFLCVCCFSIPQGAIALLGYRYLENYSEENAATVPSLCTFGNALCEESRVKILKFIIERGEVTCKDLERNFSISGSTAYHHITVMTKARLIKTRNEGKTILYSLNKKFVAEIINALNVFFDNKDD